MLQGFKAFLTRGNVIDLAVAVVLGAAFGAVVASLVSDLFTPLIAAIFGKPDFSRLTFTVNNSTFHYGRFINALLAFVSVSAVLYFVVVKPMKALTARGAAKGAEAPAPPTERELLVEIRDLLARRESGVGARPGEASGRGERAG